MSVQVTVSASADKEKLAGRESGGIGKSLEKVANNRANREVL